MPIGIEFSLFPKGKPQRIFFSFRLYHIDRLDKTVTVNVMFGAVCAKFWFCLLLNRYDVPSGNGSGI